MRKRAREAASPDPAPRVMFARGARVAISGDGGSVVAAAFRRGAQAHPEGPDFAQYAYVEDGDTIHARMFAPLDNIPEDPATGSACATLGSLLAEIEGRDMTLRIHQGDDMGRPSVIGVTTLDASVTISGSACKVMQGRLLL